MVKKTNGTNSPMTTGALKRVFSVLVVLLVASVLMVGAVGAADETDESVVTGATPETSATTYFEVGSQDDLNVAITAAQDGVPTTIELATGTYKILLKDGTTLNIVNKDLTFKGSKNAVFDLTDIVGATWHTQNPGSKITFDNVTVQWNEDNEGYQGFAYAEKVVYKNCTISGTQFMYGDADFINCVFEAENTDEKGYAVYGRGAGDLTFTDCTFKTDGRAIMLYQDQTTEVNITLTRCIFTDNGAYTSKNKAVVETGDGEYKTSVFRITIEECTIEQGFEPNNSDSPLWGNKDNMPKERLTVIINGVEQTLVYPVTWKNEDGTVFASALIKENDMPTCSEGNPTKAANDTHTFQFAGWVPELKPVTTAAEYTATFTEIKKEVTPTAPAQGVTTDDGTEVTVGTDESIVLPEGTSTTDNEVDVTEATIKTDSGVNITLVYSENDKATVNKSEGTITGNTTGVVAAYPAASVQSNNAEVPVTYELELSLNPETVKTGIPLPTINTTINTDVANAIGVMKDGNGDAFEPLAMIQATYADGIDQVNNNLTGDKIKLTFVVPASAGTDFVAFHIKNGVPNLLDENSVEIKKDTPAGYTTIILTVEHFSGYAIATGTYPAEQKQTQSSSSSSSGSSVWLTETQTQQPTATPTPTETAQPTDAVPTDIPVTQPTSEPASPGFGILAALAGLGAVAALRRQ